MILVSAWADFLLIYLDLLPAAVVPARKVC